MISVVSVAEHEGTILRHLLPPTSASVVGGGRLYLAYRLDSALLPQCLTFGGEVLVDVRHFASEAEANAWIAEDVRQRDALRAFGPMGRAS